MNPALSHIQEDLAHLDGLTNAVDERWIRAVVHGMGAAYHRAGLITFEEWVEADEYQPVKEQA